VIVARRRCKAFSDNLLLTWPIVKVTYWAKDSTQLMRSQRLINQSFALLGTPFKVENSCLPKTGGGAERTKKVKDHTDAKNTQKVESCF
jgi:hypothetical protein